VADDDARWKDLLDAASALAFARRLCMDTTEEWDDLERAALAAGERPSNPARYEFRGDLLLRLSVLDSGEAEDHACDIGDIEQISLAIAAIGERWFVVDELATEANRDWITALIAVEFLKRVGLVLDEGTGSRLVASEGFSVDQALAEFAVGQMRAHRDAAGR
jgi:hypothetical protein